MILFNCSFTLSRLFTWNLMEIKLSIVLLILGSKVWKIKNVSWVFFEYILFFTQKIKFVVGQLNLKEIKCKILEIFIFEIRGKIFFMKNFDGSILRSTRVWGDKKRRIPTNPEFLDDRMLSLSQEHPRK